MVKSNMFSTITAFLLSLSITAFSSDLLRAGEISGNVFDFCDHLDLAQTGPIGGVLAELLLELEDEDYSHNHTHTHLSSITRHMAKFDLLNQKTYWDNLPSTLSLIETLNLTSNHLFMLFKQLGLQSISIRGCTSIYYEYPRKDQAFKFKLLSLVLSSRALLHVYYPKKEINSYKLNYAYFNNKQRSQPMADFPWIDMVEHLQDDIIPNKRQLTEIKVYPKGLWQYSMAVLFETAMTLFAFKNNEQKAHMTQRHGFIQWSNPTIQGIKTYYIKTWLKETDGAVTHFPQLIRDMNSHSLLAKDDYDNLVLDRLLDFTQLPFFDMNEGTFYKMFANQYHMDWILGLFDGFDKVRLLPRDIKQIRTPGMVNLVLKMAFTQWETEDDRYRRILELLKHPIMYTDGDSSNSAKLFNFQLGRMLRNDEQYNELLYMFKVDAFESLEWMEFIPSTKRCMDRLIVLLYKIADKKSYRIYEPEILSVVYHLRVSGFNATQQPWNFAINLLNHPNITEGQKLELRGAML